MELLADPSAGGKRPPFATSLEEYSAKLAMLSAREREIVELAAMGKTDEQISQALGISPSTVNSYWVRVRGKVGQHGRTEIVSDYLRHLTRQEHAELRAENRLLREEMRIAREELQELRAVHAATRGASWHVQALLNLPEAMLVTEPPANVVFANRRARRLYGADGVQLEGLPMRHLTIAETPESLREPCRELFREGGPEREIVGIDEPYYARRVDGSNFRAIMLAQRFCAANRSLAVVTVREFLADAEAILQGLRSPLGTSSERVA
jgi:DNA-binding CsgD family transcriptional regulator